MLLGARFLIALEPSSVAAAAVVRGLGPPRIRALARAPLAPGALAVSPFDANVLRPEEIRDALERVASAAGLAGGPACVVLPDGLARLALLDVPGDVEPERYTRFKLLADLPYPPEDALVDVLPLGGRRVVAAAVRRSVVEGYEDVVRAAGVAQERVDLAPLAALAALGAEATAGPDAVVDVILGEAAVSLAARQGGVVRALRNRRRDRSPGEPQRLWLEALRTAGAGGDGAGPPGIRAVGPDAAALVRRWREDGAEARVAWHVPSPAPAPESGELAWLGAALA